MNMGAGTKTRVVYVPQDVESNEQFFSGRCDSADKHMACLMTNQ